MLNKDAIIHLEKTVLLKTFSESLAAAKTKSPLLAVPDGMGLKDLEAHMPNRTAYRFAFATKSIKDFGEYCTEFDKEGAKCFVNSDRMNAKTIFDLGTEDMPLHQQHTAMLKLDKTAAYKSLLDVNGDRLNQKSAADFIEDWADNIVVMSNSGEKMSIGQAVKQLREITVEQISNSESKVNNFSQSMSNFEMVEAKNQDLIPATIEFTCVPFHGLSNRAFTIRVAILTGGKVPEISLRIIKLEAQEEDISEEFKDILIVMFKDTKLKTLIGEG
jgi:uncharacterized protein YfdQ (DUF2303 family)